MDIQTLQYLVYNERFLVNQICPGNVLYELTRNNFFAQVHFMIDQLYFQFHRVIKLSIELRALNKDLKELIHPFNHFIMNLKRTMKPSQSQPIYSDLTQQ